jgi:hypothetical protein
MSTNKWIQDMKNRVREKKTVLRATHREWVRTRQELESQTTKWSTAKTTEERAHWRQVREDTRQRLKQHQERLEKLEQERTEAIESLMDVPKAEKPKRRSVSTAAALQTASLLGDGVELQIRLVSGDVLTVLTRGQEAMIRLFDEMTEQHAYNPAIKSRMDFLVEEKEDFQPLIRSVQEKWSDRFPNKDYPVIHLLIQPETDQETSMRRHQLDETMEKLRLCHATSMVDLEEAVKAWWITFRPKWNMKREAYLEHFLEAHPNLVRPWTQEDVDQMREEQRQLLETRESYHKTINTIEEMMTIVARREEDQRMLERIAHDPMRQETRERLLRTFRERMEADPSGDWLMENNGLMWRMLTEMMTIEEMMDAGMSYERVFGPTSGRRYDYGRKLRDHREKLDELTAIHGARIMNHLHQWCEDVCREGRVFRMENARVLTRELPTTV